VFSIAPVQIAIDAPAPHSVIGIVGVIQAEALQGTEVSFDGVEPTGIGWRRNESDLVGASKRLEGVMPMRGEIILNEVDAGLCGITRPQPFPGDQEIAAGLTLVNGTGQTIVMDIVEGQ